jgi:hypothetical protein
VSGAEIALLLIALVIMGGAAAWALRAPTRATPTSGDQQRKDADLDVLAGRAAPPRDNDPRRGAGGACLAPWHGVIQGDLSTRCDLPGGWTVVPDGGGGWTGQAPGQTVVGGGPGYGFDAAGNLIVHSR